MIFVFRDFALTYLEPWVTSLPSSSFEPMSRILVLPLTAEVVLAPISRTNHA